MFKSRRSHHFNQKNTMYKIERNVPIAARKRGNRKYPFGDLNKGDSIFVPIRDAEPMIVRLSLHVFKKKHAGEKKFTTRVLVENKIKGTRVWRTE